MLVCMRSVVVEALWRGGGQGGFYGRHVSTAWQTLVADAVRASQQLWTWSRNTSWRVTSSPRAESFRRQRSRQGTCRMHEAMQSSGGRLACMRAAGGVGGARPAPPPCCLRGPPCTPRHVCCCGPELPGPARCMSSERRMSCDVTDAVRAMGASTTGGGGGGGGGCASMVSGASSAGSFAPSSSLHASGKSVMRCLAETPKACNSRGATSVHASSAASSSQQRARSAPCAERAWPQPHGRRRSGPCSQHPLIIPDA